MIRIDHRLLLTDERQQTNLHEIVRTAERHLGPRWYEMLTLIMTDLAGTTIRFPEPKELRKLVRDSDIVNKLKVDDSPRARLYLMREFGVTHAYLAEIYLLSTERVLAPPDQNSTREARIDAAADLVEATDRGAVDKVVEIYAFNATERVLLLRRLQAPYRLSDVSTAERQTVDLLIEGPMTLVQLQAAVKSITLDHMTGLESRGLVVHTNGRYEAVKRQP